MLVDLLTNKGMSLSPQKNHLNWMSVSLCSSERKRNVVIDERFALNDQDTWQGKMSLNEQVTKVVQAMHKSSIISL